MKILFSAEQYPTPGQPITAFIGVLCRELTRQGHEVAVIAPQSLMAFICKNRKLQPYHFVERVKVGGEYKEIDIYCPYTLTSGFGRAKKVTIWSHKLAVSISAKKLVRPDVCYAHMWTSGYFIFEYAKQNNIPLFVASGEDKILLQNYINKKDINSLCDYIKGTICVSTKNLEESISCGFTTQDKCVVLPNAIDGSLFHPMDKEKARKELGFSNEDFIVAFIGRFYRRKGVDRVSDAIKLLKDKAVKSIFIGTNNPGENIEPDCNGILFKGQLPHDEIPKYLNASDVFVLPSLAEGCSNSIVEAMACGLPIISSDLPFNHDILNEGNSILIDPNDINAIANAIQTLKNDANLRLYKSKNAVDSVKDLTIKKRAKKIIDFIRFKL